MSHIHDMGTKVADSAAAGSITAAAWVNLADLNTVVQIGAGIVAILAGLAAAIFHIYKTYDLRQQRKHRHEDAKGS